MSVSSMYLPYTRLEVAVVAIPPPCCASETFRASSSFELMRTCQAYHSLQLNQFSRTVLPSRFFLSI